MPASQNSPVEMTTKRVKASTVEELVDALEHVESRRPAVFGRVPRARRFERQFRGWTGRARVGRRRGLGGTVVDDDDLFASIRLARAGRRGLLVAEGRRSAAVVIARAEAADPLAVCASALVLGAPAAVLQPAVRLRRHPRRIASRACRGQPAQRANRIDARAVGRRRGSPCPTRRPRPSTRELHPAGPKRR